MGKPITKEQELAMRLYMKLHPDGDPGKTPLPGGQQIGLIKEALRAVAQCRWCFRVLSSPGEAHECDGDPMP